MRLSRAVRLLLALAWGAALPAQEPAPAAPRDTTPAPVGVRGDSVRLYVRDAGPGRSGRLLREVLARPHVVVFADSLAPRPLAFPVGARYDRTVVVIGGDVTVASDVAGDFVVVGGDLQLHPHADIEGRAIVIGGGFYNSTLGRVRGGRIEHRNNTFVPTRTAQGIALDYREIVGYHRPLVELIGLYGFGLPRYDRSNGYSQNFGPLVNLRGGQVEIEPAVTYRSHLGALDIDGIVRAHFTRRTDLVVRAGRGSFHNESWIRGDISNSIATLIHGGDSRNWWRADRAEARLVRRWETATSLWEPYVGAVAERAWSTGPDSAPPHVAFSFMNRGDETDGTGRRNPPIAKGTISSAVVGATMQWEDRGVAANLGARTEAPFDVPVGDRFVQVTLDGGVSFLAMRNHRLQVDAHAIYTTGDGAPPQRFSYLGGPGTIPTRDLLEFGGDHLFHLDSRYTVPLERIRIPFLGNPSVGLRHVIGGAGVGGLPSMVQNIGVRASAGFIRVEYMYDPERGDADFDVGFTLGR